MSEQIDNAETGFLGMDTGGALRSDSIEQIYPLELEDDVVELGRLSIIDRAIALMKTGNIAVCKGVAEQTSSNIQLDRAFQEKVFGAIVERCGGNEDLEQIAHQVKDAFAFWFGKNGGDSSLLEERLFDMQNNSGRYLGIIARQNLKSIVADPSDERASVLDKKSVVIEADEAIGRTTHVVDEALTYKGGSINVQVANELEEEVNRLSNLMEKLDEDDSSYEIIRVAILNLQRFVQIEVSAGWVPDWQKRWRKVETTLADLRKDKVFTQELN